MLAESLIVQLLLMGFAFFLSLAVSTSTAQRGTQRGAIISGTIRPAPASTRQTPGVTASRMAPTVPLPTVPTTSDLRCMTCGSCRGWGGSRMRRDAWCPPWWAVWRRREECWWTIQDGKVLDYYSALPPSLPPSLDKYSFTVYFFAESSFVLTYYKTEPCKRPPRLCRQGYACPFYHNNKDRRRTPKKSKYR